MTAKTLVHCGVLIDGTGADARPSQTVVAQDGKIAEVVPGLRPPQAGDTLLDWSRLVVIPGIFDCHDHLTMDFDDSTDPREDWAIYLTARAVRNCRRLLAAGITTLRDLGAKNSINCKIKRLLEVGLVKGPDLQVAGQMIVRTGYPEWPYCHEADGAEGMRVAVRLERKAGADWAKLMATGSVAGEGSSPRQAEMRPEEIRAAIDEAHALGIKIAAHAYGGPAATQCIELGIDSIEHGTWLTESDLAEMANRGIYLVVTYGVFPLLLRTPGLPESMYVKAKQAAGQYLETITKVHKAGVKVATGGDGCHADPAAEMKALVDGGFAPMEALCALTRNGAELCGLSSSKGTVEAGKQADLVGLARNPLEDQLAVREVKAVMKAGEVHVGAC